MYVFLCIQNQQNIGSMSKFLGSPLPLGLESADPTCKALVLHLGHKQQRIMIDWSIIHMMKYYYIYTMIYSLIYVYIYILLHDDRLWTCINANDETWMNMIRLIPSSEKNNMKKPSFRFFICALTFWDDPSSWGVPI